VPLAVDSLEKTKQNKTKQKKNNTPLQIRKQL
jgi:hypothetical protein